MTERKITSGKQKFGTPFQLREVFATALVTIVLLANFGCTAGRMLYEPNPVAAPPQSVPDFANVTPEPVESSDGSLWLPGVSTNIFSDEKAYRRGDLVLVSVVQRSSGSKQANTDTERSSSISGRIDYALGLEDEINELTSDDPANPNNLVQAEYANTFEGEGQTARTDVLLATVSAIVTDVLINGNLVIYGTQAVTLNNEASVLTVQGIVRPEDIDALNRIDSARIAAADIRFTGSGVIADKQHPGWATRVLDWIWPL